MGRPMNRTGSCLCGAVTVNAETLPTMQACHCGMCRKWGGGGPFMSVPCNGAEFTGPITRYASSEGVERGFCSRCGSCLFFHPAGGPIHAIPISLFDDPSDLPFRVEIHIEDQPDYYAFANETRRMTGAEFAAKVRGG